MNECDGEEIDFDLINLEPEPEGSSKWDKENQKEQLTDEKVVEMQENGIWYWNIGENLMKMKYIIVYDIKTEFFFHLKVTNILFDKVFLSKGMISKMGLKYWRSTLQLWSKYIPEIQDVSLSIFELQWLWFYFVGVNIAEILKDWRNINENVPISHPSRMEREEVKSIKNITYIIFFTCITLLFFHSPNLTNTTNIHQL